MVYNKQFVTSKDGTKIGYREFGQGSGLILLHGGMKSSQHFTKLATLLSDRFTVYVPDRRGRGLSGPHGDHFSVMREVEDLKALLAQTNAKYLFGLSSGALIVLRTALTSSLKKIALYEPPLSLNSSVPSGWVGRYDKEIAQGKLVAAMITALKGTQTDPLLAKVPRFIMQPFLSLAMPFVDKTQGDDVSLAQLIPTQHFDMQIIKEMADSLADYKSLQTPVLLLGGSKSPAYYQKSFTGLGATLPHNRLVMLNGLGHDGPEDDGSPETIAKELQKFFSEA